jgi:ribonuclease G
MLGGEENLQSSIENSFGKKLIIKANNDIKHEEIKIREIDIDSLVC